MDYLKKLKDGLALIKQGRDALAAVKDAIGDGKEALDSKTQSEMDRLLVEERIETRAAFTSLDDAIKASRG